MTPIRIAHIVEATVGGVARHVIDLVTHLNPAEFSCTLYLSFQRPDSWRDRLSALSRPGTVIRELPMVRAPRGATVRQLVSWLRHDEIDLVHAHSARAGYLGRLAADQLGLPAIYTPHAFPFQRTMDWRKPVYRMLERRLAVHTARIICVSAGEREEALSAGLPAERLVVIPNGLDVDKWPAPTPAQRTQARRAFGLASGDLVIGALARLVPQKGIDLLLMAAAEVLPDFPMARLLIWGEGPRRKALERTARQLHLPRTEFLGAPMSSQDAYQAMDIYAAPSRWEAGPYAVLEAMACALPVVASAVAGHVDYLEHNQTGLLVPPETPDLLDGALRTLLTDSERRERLGNAARARVLSEFTLQPMIEKTAALYQAVLAETQ